MTKTYVTPFNWDYVDDKSLIYNKATTEEEIREMIGQALDEALDDAISESVDGAVDEAINNMDIRLDGEDLLYKLIVNGNENGEINIPKDQFLKSTSYDSENKKLVFVTETTHGETTTEVNISDLVGTVADKLIGTEILGLDTNGQWYDSIKNGGKPIKTPKLFGG